jgi:hypothetical protein
LTVFKSLLVIFQFDSQRCVVLELGVFVGIIITVSGCKFGAIRRVKMMVVLGYGKLVKRMVENRLCDDFFARSREWTAVSSVKQDRLAAATCRFDWWCWWWWWW